MNQGIEITTLKPEQIEEAVEVMLTAFKDEAITSSWLDLRNPKLKSAYSIVVKIIYTIHLDAGDPIYTALDRGRVAGIAGLTTPGTKKSMVKSFKLFIRNLPRLLPVFPPVIMAIRMLYRATKPPAGLPKDYCTLEILAVDPAYQGRGIASRLLEQIERNHLAGNNYSGIYLLTGEVKNVNIYEHFGYKVVEKRFVRRVNAYHMFKTKSME
jgi:hypothetical protein